MANLYQQLAKDYPQVLEKLKKGMAGGPKALARIFPINEDGTALDEKSPNYVAKQDDGLLLQLFKLNSDNAFSVASNLVSHVNPLVKAEVSQEALPLWGQVDKLREMMGNPNGSINADDIQLWQNTMVFFVNLSNKKDQNTFFSFQAFLKTAFDGGYFNANSYIVSAALNKLTQDKCANLADAIVQEVALSQMNLAEQRQAQVRPASPLTPPIESKSSTSSNTSPSTSSDSKTPPPVSPIAAPILSEQREIKEPAAKTKTDAKSDSSDSDNSDEEFFDCIEYKKETPIVVQPVISDESDSDDENLVFYDAVAIPDEKKQESQVSNTPIHNDEKKVESPTITVVQSPVQDEKEIKVQDSPPANDPATVETINNYKKSCNWYMAHLRKEIEAELSSLSNDEKNQNPLFNMNLDELINRGQKVSLNDAKGPHANLLGAICKAQKLHEAETKLDQQPIKQAIEGFQHSVARITKELTHHRRTDSYFNTFLRGLGVFGAALLGATLLGVGAIAGAYYGHKYLFGEKGVTGSKFLDEVKGTSNDAEKLGIPSQFKPNRS